MFSVKSFLIVPVLLGLALLIYGLPFLSVKIIPQSDVSGGQLVLAITEMIVVIALCMAVVFGGIYYFTKKQFKQNSHKH